MDFFLLCGCVALLLSIRWKLTAVEKRVDSIAAIQMNSNWQRPPSANILLCAIGLGGALSICGDGYCQEIPVGVNAMHLQRMTRENYRNDPTGSCVQMSIGIAGCHCNDINAAMLPWDTIYGPAERGGSIPSRVESYCNRRGIIAKSITGQNISETIPWIKWAARTGRFAAIGLSEAHFQTLYGYDEQKNLWYVCNNNSPQKIDVYSDAQFRSLHSAVPWCVILEKPSSPPPQLLPWWK